MMFPILEHQKILTKWVAVKTGARWADGEATSLGVGDNEKGGVLAAAAFTDYNGRNISAHIVIEDKVATLPLFELVGAYVFEQLGCARLTLVAESSNLKAVRLHEKLGAIHEGTLVGAGRSGDDILISRLTPDSRIWQKLKKRWQKRFIHAPHFPKVR